MGRVTPPGYHRHRPVRTVSEEREAGEAVHHGIHGAEPAGNHRRPEQRAASP